MADHRDDTTDPSIPGSTADRAPDRAVDDTAGDTVATPTPEATTVLHEERAVTGTELHESGRVRVRKHVETYPVDEVIQRSTEHADASEREPALEGDSGEVLTLDDGSVSIPVFEEVLVVTKKLVVRERIIVRKHTVVDEHVLQTELRREHVTVDADDGLEVDTSALDGPRSSPNG
jgi:stress response protein YsnF